MRGTSLSDILLRVCMNMLGIMLLKRKSWFLALPYLKAQFTLSLLD